MSRTALLVAALTVSLGLATGQSADKQYHQTREIHADIESDSPTAFDTVGRRLLIASKRGIFAYDMIQNRLAGQFSEAKDARLAVAPDLGRVLIASGGTVALLDLADGHTIASTPVSGRASAVLYDAERHEFVVDRLSDTRRDVFVFDRDGQQLRRLSGLEDRGMAALAPRGRLLLLGGDHVTVVQTDSGATATWPLDRHGRSYRVAVDPTDDRVFVALEGRVVMLNGTTGERLASMPTTSGFVLGYDNVARRLLYSWGIDDEEYIGTVEIRGDRLVPVQQIRVPREASALHFDPGKAGFLLTVDQPAGGSFRLDVFEFK